MKEHHKIQTVYKRDPATKHKTLIADDFSLPEFEFLRNNEWIFTEKVDGTNVRVIFRWRNHHIRRKNGSSTNFYASHGSVE